MSKKIRVALIGVGNSASIFVQGLVNYRNKGDIIGLWHPELGGYHVDDIEIVESFDINPAKIGLDLGKAIFAEPNTCRRYINSDNLGIKINQGILLDKLPENVSKLVGCNEIIDDREISGVLRTSQVNTVLNLISSGLNKTTKAYAESALQAGCSFVNCTPSPIASDQSLASKFEDEELLLIGDDLMSQFGGTVFHKGILEFMVKRGIKVLKSYQLDVGGGVETLNTVDEKNKAIKRDIKTSSISVETPYGTDIVTGTTEYVDYLGNDRTSYYLIEGEGFLGSQPHIDIYLRTSDGPNAANILLDIVRSVQVSKERGKHGAPNEICAYGFKKPPTPIRLEEAQRRFTETYLRKGR